MGSILKSIFTAIFSVVFGPLLTAIEKHKANKQAEDISDEQSTLDQRTGAEARELEKVRTDAAASTGRDASGKLRDDSSAVESAIDRANGKLP